MNDRRRRPNPKSRPKVAVVRPAAPVRPRSPRKPAPTEQRPNPPADPKKRAHTPNRPVPQDHALVASPHGALEFDDFDATAMFDTLDRVRALPAESRAVACRSIAEARGYSDDELYAMAEVGYHYLRSGGLRLALVVFEGLTAIKPDEAYFWLALGLAADYLDDKARAHSAYQRAQELDPHDPRPDLNLAEIFIERRDRRRAGAYLARAARKAVRSGERALEQKARALLTLLGGGGQEVATFA